MRKFTSDEIQRNLLRELSTPIEMCLAAEITSRGIDWICRYSDQTDSPVNQNHKTVDRHYKTISAMIAGEGGKLVAAVDAALLELDLIALEVAHEHRRQK